METHAKTLDIKLREFNRSEERRRNSGSRGRVGGGGTGSSTITDGKASNLLNQTAFGMAKGDNDYLLSTSYFTRTATKSNSINVSTGDVRARVRAERSPDASSQGRAGSHEDRLGS
jgi:hypothetical protein